MNLTKHITLTFLQKRFNNNKQLGFRRYCCEVRIAFREINIQSNQRWYFYKIHTSLPDAGKSHVEGQNIYPQNT